MKKLVLALLVVSSQAFGQAYKCTINGKSVYSDSPCARDARYVGALEDSVPTDQQAERMMQSAKERRQRDIIEGRQRAEFNANQRAAAIQANAEAQQAALNEAARQRRCAALSYNITQNQRGVARYQNYGWQQQLTQQENELKSNREAHDKECR